MKSKQVNSDEDNYSYKGWIISDSFLKRTLAILGYNLVGFVGVWIFFMSVLLLIYTLIK